MKKFLTIILSICLSIFTISATSNAKIVKKNWSNCLKVAKYGIYSLGCDLTFAKSYYPLRGKNWIYSKDTFGFEVDNELKNVFKQYNIKIHISIIKGTASKLKPSYYLAENGTFHHRELLYESIVDGSDNCWNIWNGKIYVKSKNGCTVQIKFSQKYTTSNNWNSYTIKVKVKKRP